MKRRINMAQAIIGDKVLVHYSGKLDSGILFDSSEGSDPIEIELGSGKFIAGFEEAVIGMSPGESKTVQIPPEKAYGKYSKDRVIKVDKKDFPEEIVPAEGMTLEICDSKGIMVPVQVTEISENTVTLDANHPLSEQTLTFEIKLVEILKGQEAKSQ
jgi:peptidylprolyl isomerase